MAYKMNGPSLYNKKTGPVESTGKKSGNVDAYKKSTELTLEEDAKLGQKLDNLETPSDVIDNKMNSPLPHKGYNKHGWPFKDETDHEKHHNMNENRDGNDAEGQPLKSGFKMKGSPMKRNFGIGAESPMKETTTTQPTYGGINIDPTSSYGYKDSTNIPSFRDMVSLEQQQAYADKVDARRAKKKEVKELKKTHNREEALDEEDYSDFQAEYGGDESDRPAESKMEKDLKHKRRDDWGGVEVKQPKEVKSENEVKVGSNANSYGI